MVTHLITVLDVPRYPCQVTLSHKHTYPVRRNRKTRQSSDQKDLRMVISRLWCCCLYIRVCYDARLSCHLTRRLTQLFELCYLISHSRRPLQSNAVAGRSRCLCCSRVCALSVYLSLLLRHSRSCFSLLICGNQLVPIVPLFAN